MRKSIEKIISLITSAAVISICTFSALPESEAKADTSVSENYYENNVNDITTQSDSTDDSNYAANYGLCNNIKDGTILHAWSWSCNTVKENLKDIANAGFSAVQVSPIQHCKESATAMKLMGGNPDGRDGAWWWYYQPTDWKIGNYVLGSEDDFKSLCSEAKKYGIKIIVDVVPNHTTGDGNWVSQDLLNVAGGWDNLYHTHYNQAIGDYNNRERCTLYGCSDGGLYDVNTENPAYQAYFLKYLNKCIEDGASGFRYDTAKHIGLPSDPVDDKTKAHGWSNNFWPVVTGQQSVNGVSLSNKNLFTYGEVLQDKNVKESEYANYISITASNYGGKLDGAIAGKNFNADNLRDWSNPASSSRLVTWVESHDTYTGSLGSTAWMNDWQIKMAWAVVAARKDGTPLFFNRPAGSNGPSGNLWGNNVLGAKGNDQFKDPEVVAVNKFRNAMASQDENMFNYNGNNQLLAIERGTSGDTRGEVIINVSDYNQSLVGCGTNLKDGTYYDKVYNNKFVVSGGKFTEGKALSGKVTVLYANNQSLLQADKDSQNFDGDSIDITLSCSNVNNPQYSINNGSKVSFTNGTKLTGLGKDLANKESVIVTLTGTSSINGNAITKEYIYSKVKVPYEDGYLYADKTSGFGDTMYAYVYDESSGSAKTLSAWPGVKMTYDSTYNRYYYNLPDSFKNSTTQVIFTDGNNQYPGASMPGAYFEKGKAMLFNGSSIELKNPTEVVVKTDPKVSSDKESQSFTGSSITVTLSCTNTTKSEYSIDGGVTKTSFVNGKKVNLGDTLKAGDSVTLILYGSNDNGNTSCKYTYTKIDIPTPAYKENYIYADKVSGYGDTMYAYIYDESSGNAKTISAWPGVKMTYDSSNNRYYYELPQGFRNNTTQVIFTDGNKQYPGSGMPGAYFEKGKAMLFNGTSITLKDVNSTKKATYNANYLYFNKTSDFGDNMYVYIYDESNGSVKTVSAWPGVKMSYDSENERYYYELPESFRNNTTQVIFTDGTKQYPGSGMPGVYFEKGKAMLYDSGKISIVDPDNN